MSHLVKYLDYLKNAGNGAPVPVSQFDEDFEPIGPTVRLKLRQYGLTLEEDGDMIVRSR